MHAKFSFTAPSLLRSDYRRPIQYIMLILCFRFLEGWKLTSAEYAVPRTKLTPKAQSKGSDPTSNPIARLNAAETVTIAMPVFRENSPDANGRYGLFTYRNMLDSNYCGARRDCKPSDDLF